MKLNPASVQNVLFADRRLDLDTSQVASDTKVVKIAPHENGVATIAKVLSRYEHLDSVQVLSHGNEASLYLGSVELSAATLAENEDDVRGWGRSLESGDLLLFGCNVASSDRGRAFVDQLAALTGANVAASENLTGNAALGGDWELGYQVGTVTAAAALPQEARAAFAGVLVGTYGELVTALGTSGEINLTADITLEGALPSITVEKEISISGNNFTISGNDQYQVFNIDGGVLQLNDLTIANGFAKGGTGVNGAGGGMGAGGGIYMDGGFLIAEGVTFTGNTAAGGDSVGRAGTGGIKSTSTDPATALAESRGGDGGKGGGLNGATTTTLPFPPLGLTEQYDVDYGINSTGGKNNGTGGEIYPDAANLINDGNATTPDALFGSGGVSGAGGAGLADDAGLSRLPQNSRGVSGTYGAGSLISGDQVTFAGGGGGGGAGSSANSTPPTYGRGTYSNGSGIPHVAAGIGTDGSDSTGDTPGLGGYGGGGSGVGGAIFVKTGNVALIDSTFTGNSVAGGISDGDDGIIDDEQTFNESRRDQNYQENGFGFIPDVFNFNGTVEQVGSGLPTFEETDPFWTWWDEWGYASSPTYAIPTSFHVTDLAIPTLTVTGSTDGSEEGETAGTITVTASPQAGTSLDIPVSFTLGGTATPDDDYFIELNGQRLFASEFIIPSSVGSFTLDVVPVDDSVLDLDETVTLTLTDASSLYELGGTVTEAVTIEDNEATASVVSVSASITEENGVDQAAFTINLDRAATNPITVNYSVSGTAEAGNDADFAPLSGSVLIGVGEDSATVSIEAFDDEIEDNGESIVLTLDDPALASGYILDEDNKEAQLIVLDGASVREPSLSDDFILVNKTGSRTAVIEESDEPDSIEIVLVQQPDADLTLSFETGDDLEAIDPVTIAAADWATPVTVNIFAATDGEEEEEETFDLTITPSGGGANFDTLVSDPDYAIPAVPVVISDPEIDSESLANVVNTVLRQVDFLLASQLEGVELPLVGALGNYTANFIEAFRGSLVTQLDAQAANVSPSEIGSVITDTISNAFGQLGVDAEVGIDITTSGGGYAFQLKIVNTYDVDADLPSDLGFPELGLDANGNIAGQLEYDFDLGFGWQSDTGFFVDTETTQISTNFLANLSDDFRSEGLLGFLKFNAEDNPEDKTEVGLDVAVDLKDLDNIATIQYLDANGNDAWDDGEPRVNVNANGSYPDLPIVGRYDTNGNGTYDGGEGSIKTQQTPDDGGRLTLSELGRSFTTEDLFDTIMQGDANIGLTLETDRGGNTAMPSYLLEANVDWEDFGYKDGVFQAPPKPTVSFDEIKLDVGSFANFAQPIFEQINDVFEPMRPFIDFLNQDITFLSAIGLDNLFGQEIDENGDGRQSLVELIAALPDSEVKVQPFIDVIEASSNVFSVFSQLRSTEGKFLIDLGSYQIDLGSDNLGVSIPNPDGSSQDPDSRTSNFELSVSGFSFDDFVDGLNDLFDPATAIEGFTWPSALTFDDFSGGLTKVFTQASLRGKLPNDLEWQNLSLGDFVAEFEPSSQDRLRLSSTLGDSGVTLAHFTLALGTLFGDSDPGSIEVDWSKLSLDDFALGLNAIAKGHAGLRGRRINLSEISFKELADTFESMFVSGDFSLKSPEEEAQENNTKTFQPKPGAPSNTEAQVGSDPAGKRLLDTLDNLDTLDGSTLEFPLLTKPDVALSLLLGKTDTELFLFDVPALGLDAGFEFPFPVFGPLELRFGGEFEIGADLAFGFDTQGLVDWKAGGSKPSEGTQILDGFYLSDTENANGTGEDVDELTASLKTYLDASIGLGVPGLRLEAFARGGLIGELGLDFRDGAGSLGAYDGKIRALSEFGANSAAPWQLFNLSGTLSAFATVGLRARIEIFKKILEQNLFTLDFGPWPLAEFEYGPNGFSVSTVFDGPIAGGTVFFDTNFNGLQEADEPSTMTQIDGSYQLAIPLEVYDINGNGEIDQSEGQVIIKDGVDTDTFQDQRFEFITAPDWDVASPMTLLATALEKPDPAVVEAQIETALGLPASFALYDDSPLLGTLAGNSDAATVFRIQAQFQNLLILGGNVVGEEGDRKPGALALIEGVITRIQAGETIDFSDETLLTELVDEASSSTGFANADDRDLFLEELVYLNQELSQVSGTGESARAAVAELVAYDFADKSYLDILETPWVSLLRAAVPVPDTETSKELVAEALNLPPIVDIATYNTIAELETGSVTAAEVYVKQIQLNATWTQVADVLVGLGTEDADDLVIEAFINQIAAGTVYDDLSNPAQLLPLLDSLAPELGETLASDIVGVIADRNGLMNESLELFKTSGDLDTFRDAVIVDQVIAQSIQSGLLQSVALGEITIDEIERLLEYNIELNLTSSPIEQVIDGTASDDTLTGDGRNDLITGFAGNDLIVSNGGNDIVFGSAGNDTIDAGDGDDAVAAGQDDDFVFGGAGLDFLAGNTGNDSIDGGAGDDFVFGGKDNDTLNGDEGNDQLQGDLGDDLVRGGLGNDVILGGNGADTLEGNGGDDLVFGNLGQDLLSGGDGKDSLLGGKDADTLTGDAGDDYVLGNIGEDMVLGNDGNDVVHGGKDNDILQGGSGNDTLSGDLGNDILYGETGADVFQFRAGHGRDIITDFVAGEDQIELIGFTTSFAPVVPETPPEGTEAAPVNTALTFGEIQFGDANGNLSVSVNGEELVILNGILGLAPTDFVGIA